MGSVEQAPFHLTEVDRQVLAQTDDEFQYHDWADLQDIVARNDLGALRRKPSDLRRYISWTNSIKAEYGSITNYVCQKRLRWLGPDSVNGQNNNPVISFRNKIPFADPEDYKILRNDWPYGVTPDISHLVVWTKTPIPVKEENGDLTDESRALIDDFVTRTFVQRLQSDSRFQGKSLEDLRRQNVLWFKNWTALQSVRSVEHFHVLLKDVPDDLIVEWTQEKDVVR
ncbi:hypothetical protein VTN31DRAFT_7181 [Thermomyces dupontii]|uniref:uncharacterized protein n=1 Tax=Talaromyces thermophilus TaxID=28565 RepID=UPI003742DA95